MIRSLAATFFGYLVFAVSSAVLFATSGRDPHRLPTPAFLACAIIYGAGFASLGGYLAARIAGRRPLLHAAGVATLIGVVALVAMVAEWRAGSVWTELAVLIVMVPSALLGGVCRARGM